MTTTELIKWMQVNRIDVVRQLRETFERHAANGVHQLLETFESKYNFGGHEHALIVDFEKHETHESLMESLLGCAAELGHVKAKSIKAALAQKGEGDFVTYIQNWGLIVSRSEKGVLVSTRGGAVIIKCPTIATSACQKIPGNPVARLEDPVAPDAPDACQIVESAR
jgi:hypothetical protein